MALATAQLMLQFFRELLCLLFAELHRFRAGQRRWVVDHRTAESVSHYPCLLIAKVTELHGLL